MEDVTTQREPDARPSGLRERKKARTHDAIVLAALDLFEQKGFEATTVEEIAEAADVSPRTFFRYFDSKIEVMMMPKEGEEEFAELLASRPAHESPVEAMRQVTKNEMLTSVVEDPLMVRRMRLMFGTPELRAIAREHFNEHEAELVAEFAKRLGVAEGDLRPHVLATALSNTIWTTVALWISQDRPPQDLFEMIDEAFDVLAEGLHETRVSGDR